MALTPGEIQDGVDAGVRPSTRASQMHTRGVRKESSSVSGGVNERHKWTKLVTLRRSLAQLLRHATVLKE